MNELDLMAPSKVAEKYGGDKRKIAEAARMGLIDPTVAVMAGMFIDRMRGAAAKEQQPQSTVAQDVLRGVPAAAAAPVDRGLTALPAADNLYNEDSFAGGGIIAFQGGGLGSTFDEFMPQEEGTTPLVPTEVPDELIGKIGLSQVYDIRSGRHGKTKEDILRSFGVRPTPATPTPSPAREEVKGDTAADRVPANVDPEKAEKAVTDYAEKLKKIYKEFGVSEKPDAEARAAIEKYREKLVKDLDKAGALGLVQAGLGIAGGKSQYALQNIGQGAEKAVSEYGRALEKIRGEEKGLLESEVKLAQADDARRRGDAKLALELEKEANSLAVQERRAVAAEKQAARPTEEELRQSMFGRDPEAYRRYREATTPGFESAEIARQKAVAAEFTQLYGTKFMQLSGSKKPEDQAEARKMLTDFYASRGVRPPMGGASGTSGAGAVDTKNPLLR